MEERQVALKFNAQLWTSFRAICVLRNTSPTKEINRFVKEQVAGYYADTAPPMQEREE